MLTRRSMMYLILAPAAGPLFAGIGSNKAAYSGGTITSLKVGEEGTFDVSGPEKAVFKTKSATLDIPYKAIDSLEYGQKAGRRVGVAVAVTPLALFSKKRKHYLTITYVDSQGARQGVVFELGKDIVRTTLLNLQVRTGKELEFESEEAKKEYGR
jgi:hypothetical protein